MTHVPPLIQIYSPETAWFLFSLSVKGSCHDLVQQQVNYVNISFSYCHSQQAMKGADHKYIIISAFIEWKISTEMSHKFSLDVNLRTECCAALLGPPILQHCWSLALQKYLVFVCLPAVLKYLTLINFQRKKILSGKYCDRTEVILVVFPTVRIETFVFAQLRAKAGIYLLELYEFFSGKCLSWAHWGFASSVKQSSVVDVHERAWDSSQDFHLLPNVPEAQGAEILFL